MTNSKLGWYSLPLFAISCANAWNFQPFEESIPDGSDASTEADSPIGIEGGLTQESSSPSSDAIDDNSAVVTTATDGASSYMDASIDVAPLNAPDAFEDAFQNIQDAIPTSYQDAFADVVFPDTGATPVCPNASAPDLCSGTCVDIMTDPGHCGSCSIACGVGLTCVAGGCTCEANAPKFCSGTCVDTQTDHANCGGCSTECTSGESCHAGVCEPCGSDYATDETCSGVCVDPTSDAKNCGGCGNTCPSGASCKSKVCTCPSGDTDCNSVCVDLSNDRDNCGSCNSVCKLTNASSSCSAKTCVVSACNPGFNNCDKIDSNGCESNPLTDVGNCGTCGHACAAGMTCSSGACICPSGTNDCGGVCYPEDGIDPTKCGPSCTVCPAPLYGLATCHSGVCGQTCINAIVCNNVCTQTANDINNCGGCGNACASGDSCVSGVCVAPYVDAGMSMTVDTGTTPPPMEASTEMESGESEDSGE
jgi:hypothetical protein